MEIVSAVRNYLQEHGIKQSFVSQKCGWSRQKTSCIINGKSKMTAEEYQALCKALKVPYELFLDDRKEAPLPDLC